MPRSPRVPSYRLHKPSGQAVVTIAGKDFYLGPHGSPQSQAEYQRLLAEWLAGGNHQPPLSASPPAGLTLSEALAAYLRFAGTYYRLADPLTGQLVTTTQFARLRYALGPVRELYGHTPLRDFGPLALKAVRAHMLRLGWCRTYTNSQIDVVKRFFKWAVGEELAPSSVYEALRAVPGLKAGRTEAREAEPVQPVPEAHIRPVQAEVLPQVRDLIELQLLTAMRPGEALALRPADVDRSGAVWLYRPAGHKTRHHGHERIIFLGPKGQAVLLPYLSRQPASCCFSPREATAELYARLGRRPGPLRYHDRYQSGSYSHADGVACERLQLPPWHPHQLRHNAATRLVAEFGWDLARIILGHRSVSATRIYAADNLQRALEVMSKVG